MSSFGREFWGVAWGVGVFGLGFGGLSGCQPARDIISPLSVEGPYGRRFMGGRHLA